MYIFLQAFYVPEVGLVWVSRSSYTADHTLGEGELAHEANQLCCNARSMLMEGERGVTLRIAAQSAVSPFNVHSLGGVGQKTCNCYIAVAENIRSPALLVRAMLCGKALKN